MSQRWGDSASDRRALDNWITREPEAVAERYLGEEYVGVGFSAGDWDFGSDTLADEVADLDPGRFVGDQREIDEVDGGHTLIRTHRYTWDGSAWQPDLTDGGS